MASNRILIATSSFDDRQLFKEILLQLDKRSTFWMASDGRTVIDILQSLPLSTFPDLIISEYRLPGLPAEDILAHLNRISSAPFILKLIWDAPSDKDLKKQCHELGAHLLIPQDIRPSDLKLALANLLLSFPKGTAV